MRRRRVVMVLAPVVLVGAIVVVWLVDGDDPGGSSQAASVFDATDASVWVSDGVTGALIRVAPDSGAVLTRWEAIPADELAVSPSRVWVLDAPAGRVISVDRATARFAEQLELPGATALTVVDGQAWVGAGSRVRAIGQGGWQEVTGTVVAMDGSWILTDQAVLRIDDRRVQEVTRLDPFLQLTDIAEGEESAWLGGANGQVLRVNVSGSVRSVAADVPAVSALVADGRAVWFVAGSMLARAESGGVVDQVEIQPGAVGPAVDTHGVWVGFSQDLVRVDRDTLTEEAFDLGDGSRIVAVDAG